jgi:nucleoside-diphosphate-sugar epimerase
MTQKTTLVTGGAGFVGSHLCERLVKDGHKVISLDNYFVGSKNNHVPGVEYREGHTKDITKHISEKPDIVYHLGEYSRVEISLTEPALVWDLNIYGPRERPAHEYGTLIETFRRQKAEGKKLTVVSPGSQKRNFTHVDDIVEGLVLVGEKGSGDEYGLGAPDSYPVLEVARMFGGEIEMLPERKGNRMDATLDTTKAEGLGWNAKHKLNEYIRSAQ